mmetsp:Transcript_3289/g.5104  ORF Transcript_3289/g.5104 Transcript_3289/m.5104 type:complete len:139 (+) Transcript_3289:58-474(+)
MPKFAAIIVASILLTISDGFIVRPLRDCLSSPSKFQKVLTSTLPMSSESKSGDTTEPIDVDLTNVSNEQKLDSSDLKKSVIFKEPSQVNNSKNDGEKARIIVYIVLSLIPCLLLLPLMSTNELKPLDPELLQQQMKQK